MSTPFDDEEDVKPSLAYLDSLGAYKRARDDDSPSSSGSGPRPAKMARTEATTEPPIDQIGFPDVPEVDGAAAGGPTGDVDMDDDPIVHGTRRLLVPSPHLLILVLV
jgi:hypothetical protein